MLHFVLVQVLALSANLKLTDRTAFAAAELAVAEAIERSPLIDMRPRSCMLDIEPKLSSIAAEKDM